MAVKLHAVETQPSYMYVHVYIIYICIHIDLECYRSEIHCQATKLIRTTDCIKRGVARGVVL